MRPAGWELDAGRTSRGPTAGLGDSCSEGRAGAHQRASLPACCPDVPPPGRAVDPCRRHSVPTRRGPGEPWPNRAGTLMCGRLAPPACCPDAPPRPPSARQIASASTAMEREGQSKGKGKEILVSDGSSGSSSGAGEQASS
ncbi:hypothetical protein C2845_PM15G01810 [Panicum miliaceum]|uniref:Uncharacterized protein n=1 Tax=Panicum miliaceum TaxID=4540 RepID=A0A3L6Q4U2_PANMI|nr:hypothetical protein C2845_PM15G01810 [Panicum miliaceum]